MTDVAPTVLLFSPLLAAGKSGICSNTAVSRKILGTQVAGESKTKITRSNIALKFYAGKAFAILKNPISNFGNFAGYDYAGKAFAI
jgi:hypothetical protein